MSIEKQLLQRANSSCELCNASEDLSVYEVPQSQGSGEEVNILICKICSDQIMDPSKMDVNHWRCLNDSMWSTAPAVQIMAYRILHQIKDEGWPQDLLDMMYLDEEQLNWAKANITDEVDNEKLTHRDVNGVVIQAGDSVVLIKDLKVKGSSMVAKQGTAVRRISLDPDNEEYIEGKVDGQHIVIITKYVKKI
jgi:protein PhnA